MAWCWVVGQALYSVHNMAEYWALWQGQSKAGFMARCRALGYYVWHDVGHRGRHSKPGSTARTDLHLRA
eukprot:4749114-Ditylum_brightwellii.AAC.1